ncbi:MAG: EAL domain-containing protein [Elusimicrobia bacterium]|nr:EAL domain-containing protein [Elusimicrobiota bacterium]MBK7206974.1 EAL domain-containing protein [Elusimicrobiota bacterium]MBK7545794.1 EAL domain-containing protein [Elusimicrobiota bacterium]MBK7575058.1 EAL domain-containing protein [Elusimicrobiota bacterium]MBK7687676.1 EAL domain-containing protein [Elusimicrobiota bacterium]
MNLDTFIQERGLRVVLKPLVSIKQKASVGHEARLRGPEGFRADAVRLEIARAGETVGFDRWFRRESLNAFKAAGAPGLLLLGFETSVLDQGVAGSGHVGQLVAEMSLDPSHIVLAIRESKVEDAAALKDFVARYRAQGFLIALRELGEGHSNLKRLTLTRPDMIKVSAGLGADLDKTFVAREIVKSLAALSRKIGALIVAEGVVTEDQALAALDIGVDMLQGPFFGEEPGEIAGRIEALAARHKTTSVDKSKTAQRRARETEGLLSAGLRALGGARPEEFDAILERVIRESPAVECLFAVNPAGAQVSETHVRPGVAFKRSALFHPARPGADHSMKEYVYLLMDGFMNRFRTDPYVSLASGNPCVTLSGVFRDAGNNNHILCMDVPWD